MMNKGIDFTDFTLLTHKDQYVRAMMKDCQNFKHGFLISKHVRASVPVGTEY